MRMQRRDHLRKASIMQALSPTGFLRIGASDLEYRMIGPAPADAPTIVMLHEGLGSAGLWGDFPDRLFAPPRAPGFLFSPPGRFAAPPGKLPPPPALTHTTHPRIF